MPYFRRVHRRVRYRDYCLLSFQFAVKCAEGPFRRNTGMTPA